MESDEEVDVIRHDDEAVYFVELFVIVEKAVGYDLGVLFVAEKAIAEALVEPLFELGGEGLMEELFGALVPGFWVAMKPFFLASFPVFEEGLGDGVIEPPGDKDVDVFLLPVGEVVMVDF